MTFRAAASSFTVVFVFLLLLVLVPVKCSNEFVGNRHDDFLSNSEQIELLNIGNSHGHAIHFPTIGFIGHSLQISGGDIESAHLSLRASIDRTANLKFVTMPMSPGMLHLRKREKRILNGWITKRLANNVPTPPMTSFGNFSPRELWALWTLQFVEKVRTSQRFIKSSLKTHLLEVLESHFRRETMRGIEREAACSPIWNSSNQPHEFGHRNGYQKSLVDGRCLPQLADVTISFLISRIEKSNRRQRDAVNHSLSQLDHIAGLVVAKGAMFVIYVPPFTAEYFDHSDIQKLWKLEFRLLKKFAAERSNVLLLDYHDLFLDSNYLENNHYYFDASHLSLNGAIAFSEVLRLRIQSFN